MRAWIWLRSLAILLLLFAAGHTLGTAAPRVRRGPAEAAVFEAMQRFRFPVMGFTRSYWDFYRGFALTIGLLLAGLAVVAWQAAAISRRDPRLALPLGVLLAAMTAGLSCLSAEFFFGAPILFSVAATGCAVTAVGLIVREGRAVSV
jgi:hypothetical protein